MKHNEPIIEFEDLVEFIINPDFSVMYSKQNEEWFIEDFSDDGLIIEITDIEKDFSYKEEIITKENFLKFKEIMEKNNERN
jgi:uncharacterized protein YqgQ